MSGFALCLSLLIFISGFKIYSTYGFILKGHSDCSRELVYEDGEKNALRPACNALAIAAKNGFQLNAARSNVVRERDGITVGWDDNFITDLQTGLIACRAL